MSPKKSSFFTIPFNEYQIISQIQTHFMKYIDFKPYSYQKLFHKMDYEHFTFNPVEYITFSLQQEFRYRNRQEIYDMDYDNALCLLYPDKIQIFESTPFTQPLDDASSLLNSVNVNHIITNFSGTMEDKKSLKLKIREATTQRISYMGENGQSYEKKLIPNLKNIIMHTQGIGYLWNCFVSTKFNNKSEFKVRISNGEIYPRGSFAQKKVTCKVCRKFEDPQRKKNCSFCKKNICNDCAEKRTIFRLFDKYYCPKCVDQGIKTDKKKIRLRIIIGTVFGGIFILLAYIGSTLQ